MINLNELRIGVLVYYYNSIKKVDGNFIASMEQDPDGLEAIPLTEEWLSPKADFLDLGLVPSGYFYNYGDGRWIDINYVHQYQNLYFALTGEELTLKP